MHIKSFPDTSGSIQAPLSALARRFEYVGPLKSTQAMAGWIARDITTGRTVRVTAVTPEEGLRLEPAIGVRHLHLVSLLQIIRSFEPDMIPRDVELPERAAIGVCELVSGTTLHRMLEEGGPIAAFKAVAWTLRLLDAVEALHGRDVVHGSLSPRSIVAAPRGRVIPPVLSQLGAPVLAGYCSPEVLRGGDLTPADDVWALHATLYRAVTGQPPFDDTSVESLQSSIAKGQIAPLPSQGVAPAELQRLLEIGLDPNASQRTTSVGELRRALDRWERGEWPAVPRRSGSVRPAPRFRTLALGGSGLNERRFAFGDRELPNDEGEPTSIAPGRPSVSTHPGSVPPGAAVQPGALSPLGVPLSPSVAPPGPARRGRGSLPSIPFRGKRARWPWIALSWVLAGAVVVYAVWAIRRRERVRALFERTPTTSARFSRGESRIYDPGRPPQTLIDCVGSYFPANTFTPKANLEFVCEDRDFRDITRELHQMASFEPEAGAAPPTPSPEIDAGPLADAGELVVTSPLARRTWDLGWYELAATAVIRVGCCTNPRPIELPATKGWCQQLEKVVRQIAEDSRKPMDLAPTVRVFDEAVTCLFANNIERPYAYLTIPTDQNRATFQRFLTKAAESDARRSASPRRRAP